MSDPKFISIPDDEYFDIYAVSSSGLRCFSTEGSWMYYKTYVTREVERDYTDALRHGHAIHCAVELGDDWRDVVYRQPDIIDCQDIFSKVVDSWESDVPGHFSEGQPINTRSPIHREYLRLHEELLSGGKLRLSDAEISDVEQYRVAISENDECLQWVLADGMSEVSCFRTDERTGMPMKCKLDKAVSINGTKTIIDIKSTRKPLPHQFVAHACGRAGQGGLGYHYQAEWYLRVTGFDEFKIIAVTKTAAPEAFLFTVPESVLQQARDANDNHLWSIANCHEMDSWHNTGHNADLPLDPFERIPL